MALASIKLITENDQVRNPPQIEGILKVDAYNRLRFPLDCAEYRNRAHATLNSVEPTGGARAQAKSKSASSFSPALNARSFNLPREEGQPLDTRFAERAGQNAESWEDGTASRNLYDVRGVFFIVGSEGDDESATVDF